MRRAVGRTDVVVAQGAHADALLREFLLECTIVLIRVEMQQEVEARATLDEVGMAEESARLHRVQQSLAPLAVAVAHAVDVLLKVAAADEARERVLLEVRDGAAVEAELAVEDLDELVGQDHVADADGRRQGLREGVHVDDAAADVDAHHRRDGPAGQTELAVVVVLDDIAALGRARPTQELIAAADWRDAARREVV